jgi:hypothetical protein
MKAHRWVVVITYELTEEQAGRLGMIQLDHENRVAVSGPGCLDCEVLFKDPHAAICYAPAAEAIEFGRRIPSELARDSLSTSSPIVRSEDRTELKAAAELVEKPQTCQACGMVITPEGYCRCSGLGG